MSQLDPQLLTNSGKHRQRPFPRAAYLHVPFCVHRCGYCDFTVITGRDDLLETYLDCLEREISSQLVAPREMETLFIGGGTPSYLPAPQLQRLLQLVNDWLPLSPTGEFSVECNPDRFTVEQMTLLADAGVNRISLGVQSFQQPELETLERTHSPETVSAVVEQLRQVGINNISIDLIYAVPGQSLAHWKNNLEQAIALKPAHISTYGLTYEKGTSFWTRRSRNTLAPAAEELERTMYDLAMSELTGQGYLQYELSNFALPGAACRHNQTYWNAAPYWGFGPGAASDMDGVRRVNHRSTTTWIKRVKSGNSAVQEQECLDKEARSREAVMLGLRQTRGVSLAEFQQRYHRSVRDLAPEAYDQFIATTLLEVDSNRLRLTREGRFLGDTVMAEFL